MYAIGRVEIDPKGVEMACFSTRPRMSYWVSRDGAVRRRYHDTLVWSEHMIPTVDGATGALCTVHRTRLSRAIALGWKSDEPGRIAVTTDPCRGIECDNVEWRGDTPVSVRESVDRARYIPPCVERVASVMFDGATSIDEVCTACRATPRTAWNYAATAAARFADLPSTIVPREVCAVVANMPNLTGSLRDVVDRMSPTDHDVVFRHADAYNMLRVARAVEQRERARAASTTDFHEDVVDPSLPVAA